MNEQIKQVVSAIIDMNPSEEFLYSPTVSFLKEGILIECFIKDRKIENKKLVQVALVGTHEPDELLVKVLDESLKMLHDREAVRQETLAKYEALLGEAL